MWLLFALKMLWNVVLFVGQGLQREEARKETSSAIFVEVALVILLSICSAFNSDDTWWTNSLTVFVVGTLSVAATYGVMILLRLILHVCTR